MSQKVAMELIPNIIVLNFVLVTFSSADSQDLTNAADCWDICSPYTGTVNTTRTGRSCQAWSKQEPHQHDFANATFFPDESLEDAENFCRDPTGGIYKPGCYTMDPAKEFEYCEITLCNSTETSDKFRCNARQCKIERSHCPSFDPCAEDHYCNKAQTPSLAVALGIILGSITLFGVVGIAWCVVLCLADRRDKKSAMDGDIEEQSNFSDIQEVKSITGKEVPEGCLPPTYSEAAEQSQGNPIEAKRPLTDSEKKKLKEIQLIDKYIQDVF